MCSWAKVEFPCFQETPHFSWRTTTSYLGICCSFNYHPENLSFVPLNSPTYGTRGGLSIIGSGYPQVADGKSSVLFSTGLIQLVHHPFDFPGEGNRMRFIRIGSVTSVAIYPIMTHCADDVLILTPAQRRCIQPYDMNKERYRQPDCTVDCIREKIYRVCNCHPYYLPYPEDRQPNIPDCRAKDLECFSKNLCKVIYLYFIPMFFFLF